MEEISIPWKTVKGIWKWNCEVPEKWQKVVEQNGQYIILYSSWWNEKYIFYFYFKMEGIFWPTLSYLI